MDIQERRPPPATPDGGGINHQRNCSGGAIEDFLQEDQQE